MLTHDKDSLGKNKTVTTGILGIMAYNEDSSASGHDEPWIQWYVSNTVRFWEVAEIFASTPPLCKISEPRIVLILFSCVCLF